MSKHTPGPWIAEQQINQDGKSLPMFDIWTNSNKPKYIGEMPIGSNARLIAAAPDLLEALKVLLPVARSAYGVLSKDLDQAQWAIAKATGA